MFTMSMTDIEQCRAIPLTHIDHDVSYPIWDPCRWTIWIDVVKSNMPISADVDVLLEVVIRLGSGDLTMTPLLCRNELWNLFSRYVFQKLIDKVLRILKFRIKVVETKRIHWCRRCWISAVNILIVRGLVSTIVMLFLVWRWIRLLSLSCIGECELVRVLEGLSFVEYLDWWIQ